MSSTVGPALVKQSCRNLHCADVQIDQKALQTFADSLDAAKVKKFDKRRFPLRFENAASEINFLATLAVLSFGSGYREALHKAVKRVCSLLTVYSSALKFAGRCGDDCVWRDGDAHFGDAQRRILSKGKLQLHSLRNANSICS